MAQKLYRARVTSTFYYIAEEGQQHQTGERIMEEALDDDQEKGLSVDEVIRFEQLNEWSDHQCDVYGIPESKTLVEAFEEHTGLNYEEAREQMSHGMGGYRQARERAEATRAQTDPAQ